MQSTIDRLSHLENRIHRFQPVDKVGRVVESIGLVLEAEGPDVALGDLCEIASDRMGRKTTAEVVGFRGSRVLLMPLGETHDIHPGCRVTDCGSRGSVPVGDALIGRVIDGEGNPIDDKGLLQAADLRSLSPQVPNPMKRAPIKEGFETGIRSIDTFASMGVGQRVGVFAGSGVGKSTLMGMIARGSSADINVIALIGERGRELREFIENDLGEAGMQRSVVVVSTSDQPAPLRIRAAHVAMSIAEHFRDAGKQVLMMMDSVTRYAMAQREIGLAVGEPPTSRGYTPSVFAALPRLLERSGNSQHGSITGLFTVLVEGDDMNEPVADAVRGILDGHLVLSRSLATANHYPPVDVLECVSRLANKISSLEELGLVSTARDLLSLYQKNEDLINVGAYVKGSNPKIDQAIACRDRINTVLRQGSEQRSSREESFNLLKEAIG